MNATQFPPVLLDNERVVSALRRVGAIWSERLENGGEPPAGSGFPWAQVRLSLSELVVGMENLTAQHASTGSVSVLPSPPCPLSDADLPSPPLPPFPASLGEEDRGGEGKSVESKRKIAALILAGNTPLMSWSPLCLCLLAGWHVKVKMSRDETLWPRLFWETLQEADPEVAARITLDVWPGDDPRTAEMLQSTDAVIAFGSDQTLTRLRTLTREGIPFFGFGHAVSIGICTQDGIAQAGDFARDILMYNQEGCLSAQAILVEDSGGGKEAAEVANALRARFAVEMETLQVPPVTDEATAHRVRSARDMALFAGDVQVIATGDLRWTILLHTKPTTIEFPQGHGIVQVIPFSSDAEKIGEQLGAVRGYISSVGVAGTLSPNLAHALRQETSISRICPAGEMQTPPLDWPNGNIDLLQELRSCRKTE